MPNPLERQTVGRLTLQQLWRDFKFEPDDAQQRAISHVEGPLYLPAGPGSGKTRVLLWRTLNLIVFHAVQPDQIFLGTFTEKAALQLKDGLRTLLSAATNATKESYDIARMYVGTVHALCQRILIDRNFYAGRQRARSPRLLDGIGHRSGIRGSRDQDQSVLLRVGESVSSHCGHVCYRTLQPPLRGVH